MKIKTIADEYIDVKVISYEQNIMINYSLVENSARKLLPIDRGPSSDRYEVKFEFRGSKDYIDSIITTLTDLRTNQLPVELTECDEKFFGENVDHSIAINCVVTKFDKATSPSFNVYSIYVTLLADTNSMVFIGNPLLPLGLACLRHNYESYSEWNTTVNETYYRSAYFVDSQEDAYKFTGDYFMRANDMRDFLAFQKYIRGATWIAQEHQFGVSGMFGPTITATNHSVVIEELKYSRVSPILYKLTITLVRQ